MSQPGRRKSKTGDVGATGKGRGSRRAIYVVILLLLAPILVELTLRLPGLSPATNAPRRFEPDGRVPFVHYARGNIDQYVYEPNKVFSSMYDPAGDRRGYLGAEGRVSYRLNMIGIRGPDLPPKKPANGFRVVCLGDSITFGEGVLEEDTYVALLGKLLQVNMPDKQVETVNCGVQGYGTREEVNFYSLVAAAYRPDVLIIGFCLNDATEFGETIRQNDARQKEFPLSGAAGVSKIAEILQRRAHSRAQQEEFFETTRQSFQSKLWTESKDSLLKLRGVSIQRKFRLLVVIFPVLWDLNAYPLEDVHKLLAASFTELGVEFIDLLDVFRGRDAESLWVHPTDKHPNEIAHRLAAERIAEYLKQPPK